MQIEFESTGEPVTQEQLQAAEKRLGLSLPEAFRRHLLKFNGGRTVRNVFAVPGWGDCSVEQFLGITSDTGDDLLSVSESYRGRIPPEMIPIAYADGGNLVCLCVSGTDVAAVFLWDHEREGEEGEPPTHDNLSRVADGFEEFLDGLRESDDHGFDDVLEDVEEDWAEPDFLPEHEEK